MTRCVLWYCFADETDSRVRDATSLQAPLADDNNAAQTTENKPLIKPDANRLVAPLALRPLNTDSQMQPPPNVRLLPSNCELPATAACDPVLDVRQDSTSADHLYFTRPVKKVRAVSRSLLSLFSV